MSKKVLVTCILFVLFLGIIAAAIGYQVSTRIHSEQVVENVRESAYLTEENTNIVSSGTADTSAITENSASSSGSLISFQSPIDFAKLQASNEDIYAWISIPNTTIDYPIVQHPTDDSYYLDHGADGMFSEYGCPYTELSDDRFFIEFNTVIYGHNMNNGSMFGSLHDYENEDFFKEHRTLYIYTEDHTFTYKIFAAVMYTDIHIPYYFDDDLEEDRNTFLRSIQTDIVTERSIYYEDMDVTSDSKIVTLSTCDKKLRDKRFLVVAVMIEVDGRPVK